MVSGSTCARSQCPWPKLILLAALALLCAALAKSVRAADKAPPEVLRIALCGSVVRDVPAPMIQALAQPIRSEIETQTGLKAEFSVVAEPAQLAEQLANGQAKLGVFQGYELAWARAQQPGLRPLVIAVNQQPQLHALIVVRKDCPTAYFAGLKDQSLAMPRGSREHCRLFLERRCQACGHGPATFFAAVTTPGSVEEALDDVVDGTVQAALVDGMALACYQRRKPGRFAQVRELLKSEAFPATAVAYHAGKVEDVCLQRFRDALLAFKATQRGRQALTMWRLTGFEPLPAEYEQTLSSIAKAYPPPVRLAVPIGTVARQR